MTTPEPNGMPQPGQGQHPDGTHAFPPQNPAPPPYPTPPGQPIPPGQLTPGQQAPYQHPAGQPVPQYPAYPMRTPTGTLSWALGFLIFLLIPFLSGIISGAAMALAYGAAAKHGGMARENARSAANWGLTYVTLSLVLVIGHFVVLFALLDSSAANEFFPIGIPITLYFAVSILHVVLVIVGTVRASSGKVMRVPFAIPYIRA